MTPTPTPPPQPHGPLARFLTNPSHWLHQAATHLAHQITSHLWMALLLLLTAAGFVTLRRALRLLRHRRWTRGARWVEILPPTQVESGAAEAWWSHLTGLLAPWWRRLLTGQPHLVWEYRWTAHGLRIGVWVPGTVPVHLIENSVEAAWPGARADTNTPTPPIPTGQHTRGGRMRLARPEMLPLRVSHPTDPLRALLGAAAQPQHREHLVVQILTRPATGPRRRHARTGAQHLQAGRPTGRLAALTDVLRHRPTRTGTAAREPDHSAQMRAVVSKTSAPLWDTAIRYAAASTHPDTTAPDPHTRRTAHQILHRTVRSRADALASAFAVFASWNWLNRALLLHPTRQINHRRFPRRGDLLSLPELAALAHIPTDDVVPGLTRAGARRIPAAPHVPTAPPHAPDEAASAEQVTTAQLDAPRRDDLEAAATADDTPTTSPGTTPSGAAETPSSAPPEAEPTPAEDTSPGADMPSDGAPGPVEGAHGWYLAVKPLGDTDVGLPRPVGLRVDDARHHVHIVGSTGVGKSTLMAGMILADILAGRGVIVIDPKGDLITELLARIPTDAIPRVVLLDPDDPAPPPIINLLDGPIPELTVEHAVSVFRTIFADSWGPRTDDILRAACMTLLMRPRLSEETAGVEPGAATIADIPTFLTNASDRAETVALLEQRAASGSPLDTVLAGFWSWYGKLGAGGRAHAIAPLLNKLRAVLLRRFAYDVLARPGTSSLNLTDILDGGILLARLPVGALGEDATRLIGSTLVSRVWQAATHRARLGEHQRRDAAMYLDECQNFLALPQSIDDILAAARGYRLSMNLAHQNLTQLPPRLRDGISANARTKLFFTASPEDATHLARHTAPLLRPEDLANLGRHQLAARLVVDGMQAPPFTLHTRPLPPLIPGRAAQVRASSRARHSQPHLLRAGEEHPDAMRRLAPPPGLSERR